MEPVSGIMSEVAQVTTEGAAAAVPAIEGAVAPAIESTVQAAAAIPAVEAAVPVVDSVATQTAELSPELASELIPTPSVESIVSPSAAEVPQSPVVNPGNVGEGLEPRIEADVSSSVEAPPQPVESTVANKTELTGEIRNDPLYQETLGKEMMEAYTKDSQNFNFTEIMKKALEKYKMQKQQPESSEEKRMKKLEERIKRLEDQIKKLNKNSHDLNETVKEAAGKTSEQPLKKAVDNSEAINEDQRRRLLQSVREEVKTVSAKA